MSDSSGSSFHVYIDPINKEDSGIDFFSREVDNVKEDMENVKILYDRLQYWNGGMKEAQDAKRMKEIRAHLNKDLDFLLKLGKQINKKFDGLVTTNAAQRRLAGSGDDQTRESMISDLSENLKLMMRNFQGLRVQMETDHRLLMESRYIAMTGGKATAEAIDNLIVSHAIYMEGGGEEADAVAEIQERRDTLKDIRRSLMDLHQIFLGIATPVESQSCVGGAQPSVVEMQPPPPQPPAASKQGALIGMGTGSLNDYEKETRKQAYVAIAIALVIILAVVILLLRTEMNMEKH